MPGWRQLDVLQAQRADLVPLQPLVDAGLVEVVGARQLPHHVAPLELAEADGAARFRAAHDFRRVLYLGHLVDDILCGASRLRWRLLALEPGRERVVEDDQRHQEPCDGGEDHCQREPVQARARLAVGGIQEPDDSEDEPPIGDDRHHLAGSPRS
eukprot:CAMPEP_0175617418 /NCGR_PEP_ID=MMETSP0096-20121207/66384_1 /TAXON_ID=311494 /ORGANISM="Alexandrium monilatum, Strain CCMP3105" /LENGTH=154 /DNA_ID=CAMNT_0016922605 /DNA_START=89 /DNA_END=553 /DNA_ORIENTATION=+